MEIYRVSLAWYGRLPREGLIYVSFLLFFFNSRGSACLMVIRVESVIGKLSSNAD